MNNLPKSNHKIEIYAGSFGEGLRCQPDPSRIG
eukprot:SAG22_NODE_15580_length_345_cov_0.930894_1_plen_32_part_01